MALMAITYSMAVIAVIEQGCMRYDMASTRAIRINPLTELGGIPDFWHGEGGGALSFLEPLRVATPLQFSELFSSSKGCLF